MYSHSDNINEYKRNTTPEEINDDTTDKYIDNKKIVVENHGLENKMPGRVEKGISDELKRTDFEFEDLDFSEDEFIQAVQPISRDMAHKVLEEFIQMGGIEELFKRHFHNEIESDEFIALINAIAQESAESRIRLLEENIDDSFLHEHFNTLIQREVENIESDITKQFQDIESIKSDIEENNERINENEEKYEDNRDHINSIEDSVQLLASDVDERFGKIYDSLTKHLFEPVAVLFAIITSGLTIISVTTSSIMSPGMLFLSFLFWLAVWVIHSEEGI